MSQRRVGPGRLPVDEGPASASVSDPMATYGRLSVAGFRGDVAETPTGGAGPIERRTATPDELAAARARDAKPAYLTVRTVPLTRTGRVVAAAVPSPAVEIPSPDHPQEEAHVMTTPATEPAESMATSLAALADAVVEAIEAQDELLASEHLADQARLRWTGARAALDAAYRTLDDPPAAVVESGADHSESIPVAETIYARTPTAQGGRATAEQLQQSRRNGQAAMQAQRRAVELTSAAAAKAEAGPKPMPAYQRRMIDALLATAGDRAKAAGRLRIKPDSLVGTLTHIRARTDLSETERAVLSTDGRKKAAPS